MEAFYQPEKVASQDEERFNLWDPYLDVKEKKLVATDGYRLVAVPVEVDDGEASGYVSRDLLRVGRKKADDGQPVDIERCVDLMPAGIKWPVLQDRKFPDWRSCIPPFAEGAEGTVTLGLNCRLLKGIADALGSDVQVALTIRVADRNSAPILVRSLHGHRQGEIGLLMPVRVGDDGEPTRPTPVVDLPPTEKERKEAAKAAGQDPNEPESMDLPGVPAAIPAGARLEWVKERDDLYAAGVPTGRYFVDRRRKGWNAWWSSWASNEVAHLASDVDDPEVAKDACVQHNADRLVAILGKDAIEVPARVTAIVRMPPSQVGQQLAGALAHLGVGKAAGPAPLEWKPHSKNDQMRVATVTGGEYQILLDPALDLFTAHWAPASGRGKKLAYRVKLPEASQACEKDHVERAADTMLPRELTKARLKGDAVAHKKRGRR